MKNDGEDEGDFPIKGKDGAKILFGGGRDIRAPKRQLVWLHSREQEGC